MRSKITIFTLFIVVSFLLIGCGGPTTENNANVVNQPSNGNGNGNQTVTNGLPETTKKAESPTTNDAPTLKPVVAAYYDALKKKDDAALRKVLASAFAKSLEADMRSEKKTSLASFVAETDKVPDSIQVRNEKIEGDKGVAEVKGGSYLNWSPLGFVKEDGVWKMTNESPDLDAVTKGSGNSNK